MADQAKDITIVCVETRDSHREMAARTVKHCQEVFPCAEAILFTNKEVNIKNLGITVVHNIRSVNEDRSYDYFMLAQLPDYIKTKHYLIVQTDGYVLNADAWTEEYLKYHYIGAPWKHHPLHYWPPHAPVGPDTSVGNGGFCLRSTLLGKAVQGIFLEMSRQTGFKTEHWYPEDCFISRDIRPMLEAKGFKFAPEELALTFSCENKQYTGQFGFHGSETVKINNIPTL